MKNSVGKWEHYTQFAYGVILQLYTGEKIKQKEWA